MTTTTTALQAPMFRGDKLEVVTIGALVGFLAASQLSVAPAYIMLAITFACWAAVVRVHHERIQVPVMFWWLAAYGVATVFSALNSVDPTVSLVDCKQLVLFLIVPVVYRFARGIAGADVRHRHHLGRGAERAHRHRPVRAAPFRQPEQAAARVADPLHDLLGRADAGGLRRRRPARLPPRRRALLRRLADLDGAGHAGPDRGPGPHLHPQRLGRAGRRRRRPDRAQGSAAARRHSAGRRARDPGRADQRHRADVLDVRRQRPVEQGPRRDAAVRRRDRPRPPASPASGRTW